MPITNKLLRENMNPIFIETGTFMGHGLLAAIWAGFQTLYSIEMSDYLYERNIPLFKDFTNVHLIHGDSGIEIKKILETIDSQTTFWLDAHYSEQCTANVPSPLFRELDAIKEHHIKTHTILIDDISDYDLNEVKGYLEGYKFSVENNILICHE